MSRAGIRPFDMSSGISSLFTGKEKKEDFATESAVSGPTDKGKNVREETGN